jgi:SAM-dependent methyltransferase
VDSFYYERKGCRICSAEIVKVLPLEPTPSGDKYVDEDQVGIVQELVPLDLYQCVDCGLVQLAFVIRPEFLYGDYIYETSISLGLSSHFKAYANDIANSVDLQERDLVVDIGSNDGTLLGHFKRKGMRVLGVEPSPAGRKAIDSGIETLATYFNGALSMKIRDEYGPASVVTANNVFANVDDLDSMVDGIRQMLAPGGVFAFETFYLVDVLRNFLPETIFHEHLCYFALGPLSTLFQRHGMEIFDARRVSTKGGSLRGLVQLAGAGREVTDAVHGIVKLEREMGLGTPEVFGSFAETLNNSKTALIACLESIRKTKKTIVGYGASVGVTTLIYQLGIAEYLDYMVDDNPAKHHRFSPGHHLPVLPSDALNDKKPDYALILAWGYADPIIGRHHNFLTEGGRFIVPLPELKVIESHKALI